MHAIWQDIRYGLRGFRKQPAFAILAAVTLGLGIGGATTIFSVIQNVLFNPFPYSHIDRNVTIEIRDARRPDRTGKSFFLLPEFLDYQSQLQSYDEVAQLLIESLLLALGGASIGALGAHFGLKGLVAAIPEGLIPREAVIAVNPRVLLFSLAAAILTSVICGLLPALRTARADLVEPLKDSGKGSSGGFKGRRLNAALVVGEVALSLVLLAGAGLLMRSFVKLQTVELGMNPTGVLHARVPLPRGQYETAERKRQFFGQVLTRVRALPGVAKARSLSLCKRALRVFVASWLFHDVSNSRSSFSGAFRRHDSVMRCTRSARLTVFRLTRIAP